MRRRWCANSGSTPSTRGGHVRRRSSRLFHVAAPDPPVGRLPLRGAGADPRPRRRLRPSTPSPPPPPPGPSSPPSPCRSVSSSSTGARTWTSAPVSCPTPPPRSSLTPTDPFTYTISAQAMAALLFSSLTTTSKPRTCPMTSTSPRPLTPPTSPPRRTPMPTPSAPLPAPTRPTLTRSGGRKKRRRLSDDADPVRLFGRLRREYYGVGTFHGNPSGRLMYELAHALRRNTSELLWLACVALTDQFVHDRITNERYQAGVMELEQHVGNSGSGSLDASGAGAVVTLKDGTKVRAPEASRIAYEDEPRLMLLREWSLFDSLLCSSYVATKLRTWTDNGLKKLKLLLARMGFPLADCQKNFEYMSMEVKRKMRDEFDRFPPEYGLTEFYYRSFLRVHGYRSKVSAADVVYGVTALLESLNAVSKGSKESSAAE